MDERHRNEAISWLSRASDDLAAARKLLRGDDPLPAAAAYHCQQCAERALKAVLAAFDQIIPKTHDLRVLVELVAQQDDHFATNAEAAEWLSPFATEFRYPSDSPDPSVDDAQQAESLATEILTVVESWLARRESS